MSKKPLSLIVHVLFITQLAACSDNSSSGVVETSSETGTETDSESDTGSNSETDSESDSESDTESNSETDSESDSETDTQSNSETDTQSNSETDSESDTGTGDITDCSLLDDFAPCGEDEICFENKCVSFVETVIDTNTTGMSFLGSLNQLSGRVWASYAYIEGLLFSQTYGHILELEDGDVKGEPYAEFEGSYASLAGSVAVGTPRVLAQYQSEDWLFTGDFADALEKSETDEANTFVGFRDLTYTQRCDALGCKEYTDNYEVLGVNEAESQIVRRCAYSKTLMSKSWSCGSDIAIPENHNVAKLFVLTSGGLIGEQYDVFAVSTKPANFWASTTALLKAELNGTWEFVDQGDLGYREDQGSPSDLHGTSPNNIWIVGSYGLLAHWDGSELTEFPELFPYESGNNRYNFDDVHVTDDRVYFLGSRRDQRCDGDVCDGKLGAIIVVHDIDDDHNDLSTYKIHQLSGLYCHTDQGKDDPDYKACLAVVMVDMANEMLLLNDEVYISGSRWFQVGEEMVLRATIWHASF